MELQKEMCGLCGATFAFRKNLNNHIRDYHDIDELIILTECDESFEYRKALGLCEFCGKTFKFRKSLYRHMRSLHGRDVNLSRRKLPCNICGKTFSGVVALRRHTRMHNIKYRKVSCTECNDFTCRSMRDLRNHLESQHGITITREVMEFDSMEQFLQWKLKMEGEESVSFVKKRGHRMDPEKFKIYYFCHRSGNGIKSSLGLRSRGPSIKMGRTCPASLIASRMPSGKISVQFYGTHTGHSFSVDSLQLTPGDRAMVVELIATGLSDTEILKKIRDDVPESCFRRVHMLNRQDLYNIKRQYRLLNKDEVVTAEQPSSVTRNDDLLTAVQNKCQVLVEMMANVDNENISYYVHSLDRLIQEAKVTIASQEANFNDKREYIGPLHDHTYI